MEAIKTGLKTLASKRATAQGKVLRRLHRELTALGVSERVSFYGACFLAGAVMQVPAGVATGVAKAAFGPLGALATYATFSALEIGMLKYGGVDAFMPKGIEDLAMRVALWADAEAQADGMVDEVLARADGMVAEVFAKMRTW